MQNVWEAGHLGKHARGGPTVVFGQVREDPAPELLALRHVPQPAHVFSIASGGCTTFALLSAGPESLTACDINPAQCALVELKTALLQRLERPSIYGGFLVSAQSAFEQVRALLSPATLEFWTGHAHLLAHGLNNCGTIDRQLLRAVRLFRLFVHDESTIRRMLSFDNLARQTEYHQRHWKSRRWEWVLRLLLNSTALRVVYGRALLDQLPRDFARHLRDQLDSAFVGSPSCRNPYLWQTFMPNVLPPTDQQLPFHLQSAHLSSCKPMLDRLTCFTGDAVEVLTESDLPDLDLAVLSNILELGSHHYAQALAEALARKMRPGGIVLLRFIFPPPQRLLDAFSKQFDLDSDLARACVIADQGLFCKNIYPYVRNRRV